MEEFEVDGSNEVSESVIAVSDLLKYFPGWKLVKRTVYHHVQTGKLPTIQRGKAHFITEEALRNYLPGNQGERTFDCVAWLTHFPPAEKAARERYVSPATSDGRVNELLSAALANWKRTPMSTSERRDPQTIREFILREFAQTARV